ncbi:methylmalonyl-CoA mutase, partial [Aquimarina celericrescens]|nr:methylmalonyl-CoA mutase [Aquimarina celericrescens]
MARKDLQHIKIQTSELNYKNSENKEFTTAEKIKIKKVYTKEDVENLEHLNFVAGISPFLRGPYSTMYVRRPWTIRQYAG